MVGDCPMVLFGNWSQADILTVFRDGLVFPSEIITSNKILLCVQFLVQILCLGAVC